MRGSTKIVLAVIAAAATLGAAAIGILPDLLARGGSPEPPPVAERPISSPTPATPAPTVGQTITGGDGNVQFGPDSDNNEVKIAR